MRTDQEKISTDEINRRAVLDIAWTRFRTKQNRDEVNAMKRFVDRHWDALKHLRKLDSVLYQQVGKKRACSFDNWL